MTTRAATSRGRFYPKMAAIGAGFFGVTLVWAVYNTYMPLLLGTFLESRALRGAFMGLDNALAILLLPLVGAWSDRVRSPLGSRLPFILVGMPLAAILFALLPGAQRALPLLLALDVLFLLAMTLFRAPVIALMPDHAPPERRAAANGVINLMGGLGGLLAFFALAPLYDLSPRLPFFLAAVLLLLGSVVLFAVVDRVPPYAAPNPEAGLRRGLLRDLRGLGGGRALRALAAISLYFVGFSGLEAQFSVYATEDLGGAARIGLATGLYYLFSMSAAVVGPGLLGLMMDLFGAPALFYVSAGAFLLAFALLAGMEGETPR